MNIEKPLEHISDLLLSQNSKNSYHHAWRKWLRWCSLRGFNPYPVCPYNLEEFLEEYIHESKPSGFSYFIRCLVSIHKYNKLPRIAFTPRTDELKLIASRKKDNIRQAPILYHDQLMNLLDSPKTSERDKALLSMMFDTMLRGYDVLQVEWQDIFTKEIDGRIRGFVRIYKTKGNFNPEGQVRVLSSQTLKWLDAYHKKPMNPQNLSKKHSPDSKVFPFTKAQMVLLFHRYSKILGSKITTHSPRVGATIALVESGITDVEIANVAGWRSTQMVKYYARNQEAENSGMAKFLDKMEIAKSTDSTPDFVNKCGTHKGRSERTA